MPEVWLLWEKTRLLGVFTSEDVVEREADERRSRLAAALGHYGVEVRTERHDIVDYPIPDADEHRRLRVAVADAVEQWPLLDEAEALLPVQEAVWDRYLMVPFEGRLWFPEFQFESIGMPWEGFRDVLRVLRDGGWADSRIFVWFTKSQVSMGGRMPASCVREEPEAVLAAARAEVASSG